MLPFIKWIIVFVFCTSTLMTIAWVNTVHHGQGFHGKCAPFLSIYTVQDIITKNMDDFRECCRELHSYSTITLVLLQLTSSDRYLLHYILDSCN
jgi:hypothetical protein